MKTYVYSGDAYSCSFAEIQGLRESSKRITYRTARNHCLGLINWGDEHSFFRRKDQGPSLKDSSSLKFYKGIHKGKPCVFVQYSGVEYIWIKKL